MAEHVHDPSGLTDAEWDQLEDLASQLEEAWKKGGLVDLAKFLPEAGSPLRKAALIELIKVDLECRWRSGRSTSIEEYASKFPELGRGRDLPAQLVFEEYRVRHLFGDRPALTIYQNRFPTQYQQLECLLAESPLPTDAQLGTIGKRSLSKHSIVGLSTRPPERTILQKDKNVSKTEPLPPDKPGTEGTKNKRREIGEYREIERLGSGAFGEVWKVELPGGIMKAVKIIFRPLDHEEAKRELESLELIKGLRHHFLLQTISFAPSEDRLRILMDLADGSLRDRLKQAAREGKKGLPLADVVRWLHEAAEALDYLHEKGVQHRDIKPENILLSEGSVRVADFGLARHQATRRLASGSGAGTPLYMPPEAWNDKQHANSDQYSLAATYAECRLGCRIYDCDGLATLMQAHMHDRPKLDPLPPDEQKVLLKALAKNPDHRYPSCTAFAEDLIRAVAKDLPPGALKGLTILEGETSVAGRRARQKQKQVQNVLMGVGVLAVLVLSSIIAALMMNGGETKPPPPEQPLLPKAAAGPFEPVPGTEVVTVNGKLLYKQIECRIAPDLAVRFNLIPWTDKGKLSFYMMENKVSNDVYEAFALANPSAVNGSRWRLGARAKYQEGDPYYPLYPTLALLAGPTTALPNLAAVQALANPRSHAEGVFNQDDWPLPNDYGARNPRWPVLHVDIQEANLCAQWLGGLLPSAEEWDKASGRFEPNAGDGPFQTPFAKGEIAIDENAPMPVGTAAKDVCSLSGCRDMAGNGLDWTRTISFDRDVGEFTGDVRRLSPLAKVATRGRSYQAQEPFQFKFIEDRPIDLAFSQKLRDSNIDSAVGFRVVVFP